METQPHGEESSEPQKLLKCSLSQAGVCTGSPGELEKIPTPRDSGPIDVAWSPIPASLKGAQAMPVSWQWQSTLWGHCPNTSLRGHRRWSRGALDAEWDLDPATFQAKSRGQYPKDSQWVLDLPDHTGAQPETPQRSQYPRSPAPVRSPPAQHWVAVSLSTHEEGDPVMQGQMLRGKAQGTDCSVGHGLQLWSNTTSHPGHFLGCRESEPHERGCTGRHPVSVLWPARSLRIGAFCSVPACPGQPPCGHTKQEAEPATALTENRHSAQRFLPEVFQ